MRAVKIARPTGCRNSSDVAGADCPGASARTNPLQTPVPVVAGAGRPPQDQGTNRPRDEGPTPELLNSKAGKGKQRGNPPSPSLRRASPLPARRSGLTRLQSLPRLPTPSLLPQSSLRNRNSKFSPTLSPPAFAKPTAGTLAFSPSRWSHRSQKSPTSSDPRLSLLARLAPRARLRLVGLTRLQSLPCLPTNPFDRG